MFRVLRVLYGEVDLFFRFLSFAMLVSVGLCKGVFRVQGKRKPQVPRAKSP